jgi:hypothetical protein
LREIATLDTNLRGRISEARFIARAMELGYRVSLPFSPNRYDCILDQDGALRRVQIKTGQYVDGAVLARTTSVGRGGGSRNYRGDADLLGIYCPCLDRTYLIPVELVGEHKVRLRVDAVKEGYQHKVSHWAKDYEF